MASQKETLLKTLFEDPKRTHVNVKFCRGFSDNISEEDLCAEVNAALFQLENKLVKAREKLDEDFVVVDVKELTFAS